MGLIEWLLGSVVLLLFLIMCFLWNIANNLIWLRLVRFLRDGEVEGKLDEIRDVLEETPRALEKRRHVLARGDHEAHQLLAQIVSHTKHTVSAVDDLKREVDLALASHGSGSP